MKRLILVALVAAGSVNAQDRALTAAEYEAQWVDVVEPVEAPAAAADPVARPECAKLARKAKTGMFFKMLAVSIATSALNTSTARYSGTVNGQRYSTSVTYRDPYKVYRSRQVADTAHNNIIAGTQHQFEKLGCGKLYSQH